MRSFQQAARQVPQNRTALPTAFSPKSLTVHAQIRTVSNSPAPYRIEAQKNQDHLTETMKAYFLTVTLSVPTLPLLSKVRSEIVCSPGAS